MTIGTKIEVSTGTLTVTALPTKVSRVYTLRLESVIGKEYSQSVQMSEESLKELISLKIR